MTGFDSSVGRRWHLTDAAPAGTVRSWTLELIEADATAAAPAAIHETEAAAGPSGSGYDVISVLDETDELGSAFILVHADTRFEDPALETEFNRWYDTTHVPEYVSADGVLRNWRLRSVARPRHYLAVYEVRTVEHFDAAIAVRAAAGTQAFDGIWLSYLDYAGSSHRIVDRP